MTRGLPHLSHSSPSSFGGGGLGSFSLISSGSSAVPRERGYLLQPRKGPRRERLMSMGAPHFSHLMSTFGSSTCGAFSPAFAWPVSSTTIGRVDLHSG